MVCQSIYIYIYLYRSIRETCNFVLGFRCYKLVGVNSVLINAIIEMFKTELGNTVAEGLMY